MDQSGNLEIARFLKERLIGRVPLIEMKLYGSRATERHDEDADMDVFIEVEEVTREIRDIIADTAWELGLQNLIHISPAVFSREEIEHSPQRESPLLKNIHRVGVTI